MPHNETPESGSPRARRRVLIVDDHQTFSELLAFALTTQPDLRCVGTADNGAQGVAMASELQPDIVVMDIEMPQMGGLSAARRIRDVAPSAVVAVVTAHRDPGWMVRATQAGASAFIPKNGSLAEMLDVLRRARPGGMLVAPSAFTVGAAATVVAATRALPALTPRERDVLGCLGKGMAPKAIARVLGISINTCRGYVKSLLEKMGVNSQLEAVVKAQELGMLDVRE
jgi:DNA-binding NarL/FixJ family response regulator